MRSPLGRSFVDYWSLRVGQDAARHQRLALLLQSGGFLCLAVFGAVLNFDEPHRNAPLLAIAGTIWLVTILNLIGAFWQRSLAARSLSEHFGFPVGITSAPTFREASFERWRLRNSC